MSKSQSSIERPRRRAISLRTKREICARQCGICLCGCGQPVSEKPRTNTVFDHVPPLRQRAINKVGTDYIPPQHSARHIDAVCRAESDRRTYRRRGAAGRSDATENARERRREKDLAGVGKPKSAWPKGRKLQGAGFSKQQRPMRSRPWRQK